MAEGEDQVGAGGAAPADLAEHLRLALDAGGLGTWRWDLASGHTHWDARMERLFGVEPGTFDGTYEGWASLLHPEDRERVVGIVERAVEARAPYRLEHRVLTSQGQVRWIEGAGQVTFDAEGNVTGTIGCCYDVTDRVATREEREALIAEITDWAERERLQRERLELVAAVNEALEGSDDLQALLDRVTVAITPRFGDWCGLIVLEEPDRLDRIVRSAAVDPALAGLAERLDEAFPYDTTAETGVGHTMRTGATQFFPDISDEILERWNAPEEQRRVVRESTLRSAITVPMRKWGRVIGALQLAMVEGHRRYSREDLALAESIADRIAASLESRRLREQRDRTARVDAHLAGLGRLLVAADSLDEVLAVLTAEVAVVMEADGASMGLVVDAEHLRLIEVGHGGGAPTVVDTTISLGEPSPVARAVRDRSVVELEGDDDGGALVASPLLDDEQQPIGVAVFWWDEPRRFDATDRLAVATVSRLCAQAVRRAQLSSYTEELAAVASSMAAARTSQDVALLLRSHGGEHLGAAIANLRLLDADAGVLHSILESDLPAELANRYLRVPVDADLPLSAAVREDRAIWLADLDVYDAQFPDAAQEARRAGLSASAVVPLHRSDGSVIGAVAFAWRSAMRFDERFRTRLTTLCDLAGQTLERASLYEAEHAVVASMQRRLLTPLPQVDGLQLAAYYEPAAASVGMGGDWYEALLLEDGSLVTIIGDVVGHGVEAVAAMSQIQHLLTGLIRGGTPLTDVLARANDMLNAPDPILATALLLHLDHHRGRLGYLSAGHPWALVRDPDGTVRRLDQNQHSMIGTDLAPRPLAYVDVAPGSFVLAYTDGLVERRTEAIGAGVDRLAERFAAADLVDPLEGSLAELIHESMALAAHHPGTTDDVAAVLVHLTATPTP